MARKDGNCPGTKQVQRPATSGKHYRSTPQPAYGHQLAPLQPQHARNNSNTTVLNLVHTIEQQACINEALLDAVRKEKASNALLNVLLEQTIHKVDGCDGYKQCLATVNEDLSRTEATLDYVTGQLHATQDELQDANECIQAQGYLLQQQANTIGNLQAKNDVLSQDTVELARRNEFTQKKLAYENISINSVTEKLKETKEKLAAAELRNNHLAERNKQLQAAVAGQFTPLTSAGLADESGDSSVVWFCILLIFAAIKSCMLLHVLMFTTVFVMLAKGLAAAPWLLGEARIYAVVGWGLVCDLLSYSGAAAAAAARYCFGAYASCAGVLQASGAAAASCCAAVPVRFANLLRYTISSAKSLVCSGRRVSMNLCARSSEVLLPRCGSWRSTPVGSDDDTPVCSDRCSIDVDACEYVHDDDDAAADVCVIVSLKKGVMSGKDVDV